MTPEDTEKPKRPDDLLCLPIGERPSRLKKIKKVWQDDPNLVARRPIKRETKADSPANSGGTEGYFVLGWLLLVGGAAAVIYFIFGFDATVAAPTGSASALGTLDTSPDLDTSRIINLGLLAEKICCVIGSSAAAVIGAILIVAGQIQAWSIRDQN